MELSREVAQIFDSQHARAAAAKVCKKTKFRRFSRPQSKQICHQLLFTCGCMRGQGTCRGDGNVVLRSMVRMVREGFAILHQDLIYALLHSSRECGGVLFTLTRQTRPPSLCIHNECYLACERLDAGRRPARPHARAASGAHDLRRTVQPISHTPDHARR